MKVPNIYKNSYREAVDHCFENLETDYITFLSSDDYLEPSYVSNCMKIMSHNPEKIKCIQSGITNIKNGVYSGEQIHFYKNLDDFKTQAMHRSPVNTPTVVYHKSLYSYDMFCGFAHEGVFIFPVNTCLGYCYRWHQEQCTWDVIKQKQEGSVNFEKVIQDYWRKKWQM